MRQKLEQYMIRPVFNRAALNARSNGMTQKEYRAEITAGENKILENMRAPVTDIVNKHQGVMVSDGSGFGIPGHRHEHSQYMIVQVPEKALAELKAVPDTNVVRLGNTSWNLPKTF